VGVVIGDDVASVKAGSTTPRSCGEFDVIGTNDTALQGEELAVAGPT
jgi:hypothetical protein